MDIINGQNEGLDIKVIDGLLFCEYRQNLKSDDIILRIHSMDSLLDEIVEGNSYYAINTKIREDYFKFVDKRKKDYHPDIFKFLYLFINNTYKQIITDDEFLKATELDPYTGTIILEKSHYVQAACQSTCKFIYTNKNIIDQISEMHESLLYSKKGIRFIDFLNKLPKHNNTTP